jgi:hypothetical protein
MGHQVIRNARLWLAEYELGGHLNVCALAYGAELQDDTSIADLARKRLGGLKTAALQMEGFMSLGVGQPDPGLPANLGVVDVPVSVCPIAGAAEGDRAFTFRAALADYQFGGAIGVNAPFSAGAEASQGPLVRGLLVHNATRTATGAASAGYQLGALSASQRLYAALHVFEVSGTTPTLDAVIESDNASNFPSATTRITFAQKTAAGSEWSSVLGAITDDWWRVSFTISGTNPSFRFAVVAGIADEE